MIAIYKITNPSGRIYIGETWDIEKRKKSYKRKDCKRQTILFNSLKKYGFENHTFEIIQEIPEGYDQDYLDEWERLYIWQFKSNYSRYPECNGMNLTDGGGGIKGFKHSEEYKKLKSTQGKRLVQSEEAKRKISEANKGKPNAFKGKKRKPFTEEHKEKIRQAFLGSIPWNKGLTGLKGTPWTEENKKLMSLKMMGNKNGLHSNRNKKKCP